MPKRVNPRVCDRGDCHCDQQGRCDVDVFHEACENHQQSANDKGESAYAVGVEPVVFVFECPVDAYAEDHVLCDLGHDVSEDHKQDSQENRNKQRKVELDVQGEHDDASHDEHGDGGNEPYNVGEVLPDLAVFLELDVCVQEAEQLDCYQECGNPENGSCLGHKIVGFVVQVEMHRQLGGQLVPQDNPCDGCHGDDEQGNKNFPFVVHVTFLL